MKIRPILLAICVGAIANATTELPQSVAAVLTNIDSVPTQTQLDFAFDNHDQATFGLAEIAADVHADVGVRMRAIHALSNYCVAPCNHGDTAHLALYDLVRSIGDEGPQDIVILRAALEAIGPQRATDPPPPIDPDHPTDVQLLLSHLGSLSRDVRVAAVHGLRDLCNTQAITPLRQQQALEPMGGQVYQAITEALRVLQTDPCQ